MADGSEPPLLALPPPFLPSSSVDLPSVATKDLFPAVSAPPDLPPFHPVSSSADGHQPSSFLAVSSPLLQPSVIETLPTASLISIPSPSELPAAPPTASVVCSSAAHQPPSEPPRLVVSSGISASSCSQTPSPAFPESASPPSAPVSAPPPPSAAQKPTFAAALRAAPPILRAAAPSDPAAAPHFPRAAPASPTLKSFLQDPPREAIGSVSFENGIPALSFSEIETARFAEPYRLALVGKFSHGFPVMSKLKSSLSELSLKGDHHVRVLNIKHILINLSNPEDYARLWMRGTWYLQGFPMRVFKWTPEFQCQKESPLVPVWIRFSGLPIHLFHKDALFSVASMIGTPLRMDDNTATQTRMSVARVCVEINLCATRTDVVLLKIGNTVISQKVVYENVPKFCTYCDHLGHTIDVCFGRRNMAKSVDMTDVVKQNSKNESSMQEKEKQTNENVSIGASAIQGQKIGPVKAAETWKVVGKKKNKQNEAIRQNGKGISIDTNMGKQNSFEVLADASDDEDAKRKQKGKMTALAHNKEVYVDVQGGGPSTQIVVYVDKNQPSSSHSHDRGSPTLQHTQAQSQSLLIKQVAELNEKFALARKISPPPSPKPLKTLQSCTANKSPWDTPRFMDFAPEQVGEDQGLLQWNSLENDAAFYPPDHPIHSYTSILLPQFHRRHSSYTDLSSLQSPYTDSTTYIHNPKFPTKSKSSPSTPRYL